MGLSGRGDWPIAPTTPGPARTELVEGPGSAESEIFGWAPSIYRPERFGKLVRSMNLSNDRPFSIVLLGEEPTFLKMAGPFYRSIWMGASVAAAPPGVNKPWPSRGRKAVLSGLPPWGR